MGSQTLEPPTRPAEASIAMGVGLEGAPVASCTQSFVPGAMVGLDLNRDGRTDLIIAGPDMNCDGIPDALQQGVGGAVYAAPEAMTVLQQEFGHPAAGGAVTPPCPAAGRRMVTTGPAKVMKMVETHPGDGSSGSFVEAYSRPSETVLGTAALQT